MLILSSLIVLAASTSAGSGVSYPQVLPGIELKFPRDEGAHPDYRIEWWYVTGWLQDERRQPLGFQVTFFRVRPGVAESNPSSFAPRQVVFGHAAIAEPGHGKLRHAERSARVGFDLAYAREGVVDLRLDDWSLRQDGTRYRATAHGNEFVMELDLERTQPALLQGDAGFSRKGPGPLAASHYYSLPQLQVKGFVTIDGGRRPVTGEAWFDHEWSSDYLDAEASGWDWMGVNLDDGGALMAFRMRDRVGGKRWAGATLRSADGSVRTFGPGEVEWTPLRTWRSPRTGTRYPVQWQVRVGEQVFDVEPLMDDAELDSRSSTGTIYWEGPVRLRRTDGRKTGLGYLELTGYGGKLEM
jgi:predicted secreted hydrolase